MLGLIFQGNTVYCVVITSTDEDGQALALEFLAQLANLYSFTMCNREVGKLCLFFITDYTTFLIKLCFSATTCRYAISLPCWPHSLCSIATISSQVCLCLKSCPLIFLVLFCSVSITQLKGKLKCCSSKSS